MRYSDDIFDLRNLAEDWRALLNDEGVPEGAEAAAKVREFERLCGRLDCETTPEGLDDYAHNRDPMLIGDWYFQRYAQDLAEKLGDCDPASRWPLNCIDWERAAAELAQDYTSVSLFGFDYLTRS